MPPSTIQSIQFIETAFSCTFPFLLSYVDQRQIWIIRRHLLCLIQDYPLLKLSSGIFVHNNGTTVNLLNATGNLLVSPNAPPVPVIIWLHENYPYMPPVVFVSSTSPIHKKHPFVDSSGFTTCPYLQTWFFPRCNLTELVRNLIKIFSHDHPFIQFPAAANFTHASLVSKMEALDRLSGMLHYDITELLTKTEEETEDLSRLHVELAERDDIITNMIIGLEHERMSLKDELLSRVNQAEAVMSWLKANDVARTARSNEDDDETVEEPFEAEDEETKSVIDCLAADRAIEDVVFVLEKAVGEGVLSFDAYLRQVRILGREQFLHRDKMVRLKGPDMIHWPH